MYVSIRLYTNAASMTAQTLLPLLDRLAKVSGGTYTRIAYTLYDGDHDAPIVKRDFPNTSAGRTELLTMDLAPDGSLTVDAGCPCGPAALFAHRQIQVRRLSPDMPLAVAMNFQWPGPGGFPFERYVGAVRVLADLGLPVNNGLCHVYRMKNEATTLDAIQTGSLALPGWRRSILRAMEHHCRGCRDRLQDVCAMGSLRADLLPPEVCQAAANATGHALTENGVFSFSLQDAAVPGYRLRCHAAIRRLRTLL